MCIGFELVCLTACLCRVLHLRLCLDRLAFWQDRKNSVVIIALILTLIDIVVFVIMKVQGKYELELFGNQRQIFGNFQEN